MKNPLIFLCGPSGVGKTTILQKLLQSNSRLAQVSIYTTRPSRAHSETKISVSNDRFDELIRNGGGLAEMRIYGHRYAISRSHLSSIWESRQIAITDYVFRHTSDIVDIDKVIIYLLPPSREELSNRLENRGHGQTERLDLDWQEVKHLQKNPQLADLVLVNDKLDETIAICEHFIKSL